MCGVCEMFHAVAGAAVTPHYRDTVNGSDYEFSVQSNWILQRMKAAVEAVSHTVPQSWCKTLAERASRKSGWEI